MAEENQDPNARITEFKPIDADQLAYAQELLDELHPLDDTPLCQVYPLLGVFTKCGVADCPKKRSKTDDENHSLGAENEDPLLKKKKTMTINGKEVSKKKKKKKKNPLNEEVYKADPIGALGFGIVAYRDILWTLIVVFGLFTLLVWPTKMAFENGTGYKGLNDAIVQYERSSLGNMGYSSVQCASIPVAVGTLTLSCPYGTIGSVYDYGVNFGDASASNCADNDAITKCKPDAAAIPNILNQITAGLESYSIKFGSSSAFYQSDVGKEDCAKFDSRFFVQYTCVQSQDEQATKYSQMCLAVGTAVLISFLFLIMIRYLYQGGKMKQIEWDMSTVTAGDYAVEFPISRENFETWKKMHYDSEGGLKETGVSMAIGLKKYLTEQIEEILDTWARANPDVLEENMTEKQKKKREKKREKARKKGEELPALAPTKIADIQFSFNNSELIHSLRIRGKKIAYNDFDGMRAEEKKIQSMIDTTEEFEKLIIPTAAFITFESDDSKTYALNNTSEEQLMYQPFRFENASEPTDIIWENRHFSQRQYYCREAFACVMISIVLAVSFIIIFQISTYSAKMAAIFPTVDCEVVAGNYENEELYLKYAIEDANFISEHVGSQSFGVLQCYCTDQAAAHPETYMTVEYDMDGEGKMQPMCGTYQEQVDMVYYWQSALSYILIGFNYIMQICCVALIDWIGYRTETLRLQKTTTATFSLQVFNSAFLIMLVNTNWEEQFWSFGLTSGTMGDFNGLWYRAVGNVIVGAMMFNIYYPLIEALLYWLLRFQGRLRDRSCRCCYSKNSPTKATSVQQYMDTYSGPLYYMHYKYASIMTTLFMTFIYGFGMPILFPIAALCFYVLYMVEKWLLFYGYRLPPMYDERLSQDVLSKLQMGPIVFCMFGYWMVSNMQILSNDHLNQITNTKDVVVTDHVFRTVFGFGGWDGLKWPLLMAAIFHTIIYFFGTYLEKLLALCCKNLIVGDIDLNEDISKYWASLDENDRNWSIKEEENAQRLLIDKILTNAQYNRLMESKQTSGKTLQGTHSYDILANPLYLDDFQYVSCAEENRASCIIDDDFDEENDCAQSDLVRVILNLAYMTEQEARSFKFTPEGLRGSDAKPTTKGGYTNPMM